MVINNGKQLCIYTSWFALGKMVWPLIMLSFIGFSAISPWLSMCRKVHSLFHSTEPGSRERFCRTLQDACHSVAMLSAFLLKATID